MQGGMSEEDAKAYVEKNKDEIDKDPEAYVEKNFPDAADALKKQADSKIEELTQQQLESDDPAVDMNDDGTADVSFKKAIEIYTDNAATQMTDGVTNYWEGSQFGALGFGTSVCLGYSKTYSYFVQCLDQNIYLNDTSLGFDHKVEVTTEDGKTAKVCDNWKTADELYYKNGKLNVDETNYTVDLVRISFQSEVTMFGNKEDNFQSDHYWNAVKVGGTWYYVDPCYTDVYTEVMSRDRVETDGDMNHAFFLFSDTSARSLYKGNMKKDDQGNELDDALRSLYTTKATDKSYESSWMARAASNVYSDGTYMYYLYDSTDLFSKVDMSNMAQSSSTEYKLVRHKITDKDGTEGDNDYEELINFTAKENENDDNTFVSVRDKDGKMVKNDALTKLYDQFLDEQSIYPSIGLTASLYKGKIYFNVSNDIMSYDLSSGEIATVKEYNTVSAVRDKKNPFGGMAFTTCDEKDADFTVNNHPIAGLTIKDDGTMFVSIATNFAFISGKTDMVDQKHYGYAYEETDYNPDYTNYKKYAQFMGDQKNDNDEFMWSANFVDAVSMKKIADTAHADTDFKEVTVPATCGRDAFTEERCPDCGLIKAGTRKTQEDTAHKHHYIKFHEVYYTKESDDKDAARNKGDNYVCPECGACVTLPVEPSYENDKLKAKYEKKLELWEAAQKNAEEGHDYTATDAKLSEDNSSITFQNLRCESCYEQKDKLDCLLSSDTNETNEKNYAFIEKTLSEAVTVDAKIDKKLSSGTCDTGMTAAYKATGKTKDGTRYTAIATRTTEAGKHQYTCEFTWDEKKDEDGKGTGEYEVTVKDVKCSVCGYEPKADEISDVVVKKDEENSKAATCEEAGTDAYIATVTIKGADGKEDETLSDTKNVEVKATGHDYGDVEFNWNKDENGAWTATEATRTCKVDGYVQKATKVEVTPKTEEATCTKGGKVTYTASATFEGEKEPLTDSKDSTVVALGHNYEVTWDWAKDYSSAKATFTCTRGDVKETVDATVEKTEENGQIVYTATATYDGVTKKSTKNLTMSISYKTHIQDIGWEDSWKKDGSKSGTTGQAKQLEAIKIKLPENVSGSVEYYSHVQDKGWEKAWSHKDGEESGTTGSFKKLEAIKIRLSGNVADNYDIYYRVHAENFGWLGWAKNGESAGTAGYNYRLEAIQIVLVKKGETANLPSDPKSNYEDSMVSRLVKYQAHVRDLGDQAVVYDGATCGTVGKAKPVEALRISLPSLPDGTIKYDAHVENIGWQNKWAKNGEMIGTKGRALQIEAIKIDLDGSVKDEYDIYYRVHSANVGWLGWAKNGEKAGTAGFAYGVEAVQIKLVKKGTTPNLPESANAKAYIKK